MKSPLCKKAWLQFLFLGLLTLGLSGCMHYYSLLPEIKTQPLHNVQQVYVYGPFDTHIYVGAKTPRIVMAADMGGKLTEVVVKRYANVLQVYPTRAALPQDIRHIALKIYVKHLSNLYLDHASIARIYSSPRAHFAMTVKQAQYVLLKGGAVLPYLSLENVQNFDAIDGPIYLGAVNFVGPGNVYIDDIRGGYVAINAKGPGYIKLHGRFTLAQLHQSDRSLVDLSGGPIKGGVITLSADSERHVRMSGISFKGLNFSAAGQDEIDLKGYVDTLHAQLSGNSELNGKWLTVNDAYVKTSDQAVAKLHVSNRIFAKTADQSRVEYSGLPKYRYVYTKDASAVLPLSAPITNALNKGDWSIK